MPYQSKFKNTLNLFLRLSGYHIMSMFVMMSILAFLPGIEGGIIAQFVGLGIIIVLPYLTVWKWGDSDCNKIANGRLKNDKMLGFKLGFLAYSPYLIMDVLFVASKLIIKSDILFSWYRFVFTPFLPFNQSLLPTTLMLSEQNTVAVIASAIIPVCVPISVGIAYYLGVNRISFSESFGFAKRGKQ